MQDKLTGGSNNLQDSSQASLYYKVGEQLAVDKINQIFDDLKKDNEQFEESYKSTLPKNEK